LDIIMNDGGVAASGVLKWPYGAGRPQRYSAGYERYLQHGGPVDLERLVQGFVAYGANRDDMARFYFFCLAFDQIVKEDVPGDIAELGVYKGNTASLLAAIARHRGCTAYLFDTFEGFNERDIKGVDAAASASSFSDTSLVAVRALVGDDNTRYLKGYFPDTLSAVPDGRSFCLVHIDCDLYEPIKNALEYFYPRLQPGGFLVVHDYSSPHWAGAEKAVDEFFADKPEPVLPLPDSAGSIVIRKMRQAGESTWLERRRAKILSSEWASAANGNLKEILGQGWSGAESWGIWGIGACHEMKFVGDWAGSREVCLELDVHAALVGNRMSQTVSVLLDDHVLAEWEFTKTHNRGVRQIAVPVARSADGSGMVAVTLVLQPRSVASPHDLDASLPEKRPVGVALHRIRIAGQS
jgi:hypothetical protein